MTEETFERFSRKLIGESRFESLLKITRKSEYIIEENVGENGFNLTEWRLSNTTCTLSLALKCIYVYFCRIIYVTLNLYTFIHLNARSIEFYGNPRIPIYPRYITARR